MPETEPTAGQPAPHQEKQPRFQQLRDLLSVAGILASAILIAFCLVSFVFQSYQVSGPSMQPTLHNGDHLIVWKVPKTIANITHHAYIPHRGDIVILNKPAGSTSIPDGEQIVKRVVGLPGDHVVVKDGKLTIYNKDNPGGFNPDKTMSYGSVITTTPGNVDVTLSSRQIFVCGDNRTNSTDSRVADVGPFDQNLVIGKLVMRILPLNSFKLF